MRAIPQRAGSEETRRQILETALRLFRERGLAAAAGLSLGATYYYFKSKEAIVGAYYAYVQHEHQARARVAFAASAGLRERLKAVFHSKIDIVRTDRRLLRGLFRYGGEPDHPLSWFGPATLEQRQQTMAVFAEAVAGERFPDDVREAAPMLLWTLHMGVLLYFLYDASPNERRTRKLIDAAVDLIVDLKRLATSPLLRPLRRRVMTIVRGAGLLTAPLSDVRG